jgi:hypothetical protein
MIATSEALSKSRSRRSSRIRHIDTSDGEPRRFIAWLTLDGDPDSSIPVEISAANLSTYRRFQKAVLGSAGIAFSDTSFEIRGGASEWIREIGYWLERGASQKAGAAA